LLKIEITRWYKNRALRLLYFTKKVLDKNKIHYWLDSGTLLGFYRDGKLLPHAKNISISVLSNYIQNIQKLRKVFKPWYKFQVVYDKSGFRWIDGDIAKILISPLIKIGSPSIGIIITFKFNYSSYTRWVSGIVCKQVPSEYYNCLDLCNIAGRQYNVPSDIEKYLKLRYGNWQVPVTLWNTNTDDGAAITQDIILTLPRKTRYTNPNKVKKNVFLTGKNLTATKKLLNDTVTFLEKNNIQYWLDFGTLLGIIRQGGLLPWDEDADICIHGDYVEKFLAIKRKFPLKYRISFRYDNTGRLPGKLRVIKIKYWQKKYFRFFNIRELHLDVFIKYKIDDYFYWIGSNALKRVKAHYHEHLDTVEWEGRPYYIPSDIDHYLTDIFGDWRTPVKDYDSSLDDRAIYDFTTAKLINEDITKQV